MSAERMLTCVNISQLQPKSALYWVLLGWSGCILVGGNYRSCKSIGLMSSLKLPTNCCDDNYKRQGYS